MGEQHTSDQDPASSSDDERLVPLPLMVSVRQREALKRLAKSRQISVGAVARDAVREYLAGVVAA